MTLTIGKHYFGPPRNYNDMCDYCGAMWPRHLMTLDADGLLRCPDEKGLTIKELTDIAAENVGYIEPVKGKTREGT